MPDPPARAPASDQLPAGQLQPRSASTSTTVARDRAELLTRQRRKLRAWANPWSPGRQPTYPQSTQGADVGARSRSPLPPIIVQHAEAGLAYGTPAVIVVMGREPGGPALGAGGRACRTSTVVVTTFPVACDGEAAWQSSLLQDGAARAVC